MKEFISIKSLSELHALLGFAKPRHPLVSVIDYSTIQQQASFTDKPVINNFYLISLKKSTSARLLYGRNEYDFAEGSMLFMAPTQVFQSNGGADEPISGWGLYFHPDLLMNTSLQQKIEKYSFFHYSSNEALHLSEREKETVEMIVNNIKTECDNNIDQHSKQVIVSNIELLLSYSQRFYNRQFITREKQNKDLISAFEHSLKKYFTDNQQAEQGMINLDFFAGELHLSKSYLSDLIKRETGKTIKEHVHLHIIDLAKNLILSTNKSVNEIAFDLGFEYPQYFSRLFKSKVGMTPLEFRNLC